MPLGESHHISSPNCRPRPFWLREPIGKGAGLFFWGGREQEDSHFEKRLTVLLGYFYFFDFQFFRMISLQNALSADEPSKLISDIWNDFWKSQITSGEPFFYDFQFFFGLL